MKSIGQSSNVRAFTIIEMVIVLAIVSILSAMTLISFSSNRLNQDLEQQAAVMASALRQLQNYALTGKTAPGLPCSFSADAPAGSLQLISQYKDVNGNCNLTQIYAQYTPASGVSIDSVNGTISFSVPFARTSGSAASLILRKNTSYYAVCISAEGLITTVAGNSCP